MPITVSQSQPPCNVHSCLCVCGGGGGEGKIICLSNFRIGCPRQSWTLNSGTFGFHSIDFSDRNVAVVKCGFSMTQRRCSFPRLYTLNREVLWSWPYGPNVVSLPIQVLGGVLSQCTTQSVIPTSEVLTVGHATVSGTESLVFWPWVSVSVFKWKLALW